MTTLGSRAGSTALLVVDLQPDFMPGGSLPVEEGDRIVEPIGKLMESGRFEVVVATQDWHPPGHVSFASSHPGQRPFDTIELYGRPQTLWPDHCVQDTAGAELRAGLPWQRAGAIVRKGQDPACDSYSAFRNNWDRNGARPPTGLAGYLRERGIEEVVLCGLARDYCVLWSAEDAADAGFRARVLWNLTRAVDPASDEKVRTALEAHGVVVDPSGPEPA